MYVVTGYVYEKRKRDRITIPVTKARAKLALKRLKADLRNSIEKYRWVRDLRIEKA